MKKDGAEKSDLALLGPLCLPGGIIGLRPFASGGIKRVAFKQNDAATLKVAFHTQVRFQWTSTHHNKSMT